jgi:hypothetical protein
MVFQVHLAEDGKDFDALAAELRTRSQQERKHVFWAVAAHRRRSAASWSSCSGPRRCSRARSARPRATTLPASSHEERVQRCAATPTSCAASSRRRAWPGSIYFQGNDRSPGDRAVDVGKAATEILGQVLPRSSTASSEAAAKATDVKKGTDALFTADNLHGLPAVFAQLGLLRDEKGKPVFRTESGR